MWSNSFSLQNPNLSSSEKQFEIPIILFLVKIRIISKKDVGL